MNIFTSIVVSFFVGSAAPVPTPAAIDAGTELVENILASTTQEWRAAFSERGADYAPPRLIFLRPPQGHPARGAGYSRTVGLVIDLGDVDGILDAFPEDGPSLVALMVAHEVGHHVQGLMGDDPEVTGAARERQADCLAGWWLARANARASMEGGPQRWPLVDVRTRLPETLRLLDILQSGRADGGAVNPDTHGSAENRAQAMEEGMGAATPWACLWGLNP